MSFEDDRRRREREWQEHVRRVNDQARHDREREQDRRDQERRHRESLAQRERERKALEQREQRERDQDRRERERTTLGRPTPTYDNDPRTYATGAGETRIVYVERSGGWFGKLLLLIAAVAAFLYFEPLSYLPDLKGRVSTLIDSPTPPRAEEPDDAALSPSRAKPAKPRAYPPCTATRTDQCQQGN